MPRAGRRRLRIPPPNLTGNIDVAILLARLGVPLSWPEIFANYTATYGAIGGVMILMLWFYISGLAIPAGAEMNAEIEHASPYGKDKGEKVPDEKRGRAA